MNLPPSTDKELEDIITGNQKYSLSGSVTKIITEFMMAAVVPWLMQCFDKYSERYFHDEMKRGFNFVEDWKTHHLEKYNEFMRRAKKIRFFIKIDEEDLVIRIEKILNKKGG